MLAVEVSTRNAGFRPVVAAVIERDGALMLCLRPQHKQHGGLWEFPGGKLQYGETLRDAVARELKEELGVETSSVDDVTFSVSDQKSGFEILFLPTQILGEPRALEHDGIAWCSPDELLLYELAPSDRAFATFYLNERR